MPINKLIITGCPRSGTTAIMKLLNTHSQIKITQELSSFNPFLSQDVIIEKSKDKLINDLIIEHGSPGFYDHLDYSIVGDKLPDYCLPNYHESLLSQDLKYVFCLRNCRGFVDSSVRHFNLGLRSAWNFETYKDASCMWFNYNKSMLDFMFKLRPDQFILMRYEDAVLDIEEYLKRISKICNFPIKLQNPFKDYYPVRVKAGKDIKLNDLSLHAVKLMEIFGYD
jgi:hypothetical protein